MRNPTIYNYTYSSVKQNAYGQVHIIVIIEIRAVGILLRVFHFLDLNENLTRIKDQLKTMTK